MGFTKIAITTTVESGKETSVRCTESKLPVIPPPKNKATKSLSWIQNINETS